MKKGFILKNLRRNHLRPNRQSLHLSRRRLPPKKIPLLSQLLWSCHFRHSRQNPCFCRFESVRPHLLTGKSRSSSKRNSVRNPRRHHQRSKDAFGILFGLNLLPRSRKKKSPARIFSTKNNLLLQTRFWSKTTLSYLCKFCAKQTWYYPKRASIHEIAAIEKINIPFPAFFCSTKSFESKFSISE